MFGNEAQPLKRRTHERTTKRAGSFNAGENDLMNKPG
jgi:hypothetical protein